jgi:hypothetical protein
MFALRKELGEGTKIMNLDGALTAPSEDWPVEGNFRAELGGKVGVGR